MDVLITFDVNEESGVDEVAFDISEATSRHFRLKKYGGQLPALCVVLTCRDPSLKFKRRIRLAKKDRTLYMDVMLELKQMKRARHATRKRITTDRLAIEVPEALRKHSFEESAISKFEKDWLRWLSIAGSKATNRPRVRPK